MWTKYRTLSSKCSIKCRVTYAWIDFRSDPCYFRNEQSWGTLKKPSVAKRFILEMRGKNRTERVQRLVTEGRVLWRPPTVWTIVPLTDDHGVRKESEDREPCEPRDHNMSLASSSHNSSTLRPHSTPPTGHPLPYYPNFVQIVLTELFSLKMFQILLRHENEIFKLNGIIVEKSVSKKSVKNNRLGGLSAQNESFKIWNLFCFL